MSFFENTITDRQTVSNTYKTSVRDSNKSSITKLSVGQTFKGEVTDASNGKVTIRLENNQTINAKLSGNYNFNVGENVQFEVKSNNGSLVEIRPVIQGESAVSSTVLKALSEAGLPVNDKSIELLKSLMSEQLPIDKTSLSKMYRIVLSNPTAEPLSLVQMTKLEIPITKENIAQFENYKNFNHQISSQVEALSKELPQILGELSLEGHGLTDVFHNQLLLVLTDEFSNISENTNSTGQILSENVLVKAQNGAETIFDGAVKESDGGENLLSDNAKSDKISYNEILTKTAYNLNSDIKSDENVIVDNTYQANFSDVKLSQLLDGKSLNELSIAFKQSGLTDLAAEILNNGEISVKDFFEAVSYFSNENYDLTSLLQNKVYHKLISMQFQNNMLLTADDVFEKENIEQYYSRLKEITNQTEQLLNMAGKTDSSASLQNKGILENLDFMNQLNQIYNYVQLPLKMAGKEAHGELYVYTKKKNLIAKEGKITALLHLDMTALGDMDVYVELEKNNVSASFRMENEDGLKFLENNIEILTERLKKRGYVPTAEFVVKEQKKDFTDEFLSEQGLNHTIPVQRYSFDMRT